MKNFKNVKIMVLNPKYNDNGLFRFGYTSFEVFTQPFNWRVTRRFKDFEWLHKSIENRFPAYFIPTMASKTIYSNEKETIKYRQTSFQDFLTELASHEFLCYSPELIEFLSLPDAEFEKSKKVVLHNIPESSSYISNQEAN